MCQCPGHGGQHHRGLQGEGGEGGRGAQPPLPGQALPRPQHSLQAGVRNNIVTHLRSLVTKQAVSSASLVPQPEANRPGRGERGRGSQGEDMCSELGYTNSR